jgi:hypothetical protein
MLSIIVLNVIMLRVLMLNVIMLRVLMLNVITLSVVTPLVPYLSKLECSSLSVASMGYRASLWQAQVLPTNNRQRCKWLTVKKQSSLQRDEINYDNKKFYSICHVMIAIFFHLH